MIRNNFRFLTKPLAALALLAGGLFVSSNAAAQVTTSGADDKAWSGAICVPAGGIDWSSIKILPSGIINGSAVPRYIACGITVDAESQWNTADNNGVVDSGSGSLYLQFSFVGAPSGTVTCTAQVINETTGTITESVSASVDGTAGDSTVYMSMPTMYLGDGNDSAVGFNCLLPTLARLNVINLEEYADTHQSHIFPL